MPFMAASSPLAAPALRHARKVSGPVPAQSDAELVLRTREGDGWAREALFRRYAADVVGLVTRLLGRRDEVDDVVQDTFATALGDLGSLREPSAFRSWLFGIAVRRVRRAHRRRSVRRFFGLDRGDEQSSLYDLASEEASPEALTELALIDAALARMRVEDRIAWSLRRIEGEKLEDIASMTGVSLATVKRRVDAVDASLQRHVEKGGAR